MLSGFSCREASTHARRDPATPSLDPNSNPENPAPHLHIDVVGLLVQGGEHARAARASQNPLPGGHAALEGGQLLQAQLIHRPRRPSPVDTLTHLGLFLPQYVAVHTNVALCTVVPQYLRLIACPARAGQHNLIAGGCLCINSQFSIPEGLHTFCRRG